MTEEMEQALIWILGGVSAIAVIGWIVTYLRLRGYFDAAFFVPKEDSLKVTYYFLDEEFFTGLSDEQILERREEFIIQAEQNREQSVQSYIYPITGREIMVAKEDTYQFYARKIHSMKPPHMRLIAIQIELIPKKPRLD